MRFFRSAHRVELVRVDEAAALAALYQRTWRAVVTDVSPLVVEDQAVGVDELSSWLRGGFEHYRTVQDGIPVGAVRLSFPNGVCNIDRLAVDPDLWRRGHGSALLDTALQRARRMGALRLWAQVSANLEPARSFYEHQGFHEHLRLHTRYWREPVILYERGV